MNGLGVSSILGEEVPGLDAGIEEFVPKANVRHFEGELTRRYKVRLSTETRLYYSHIFFLKVLRFFSYGAESVFQLFPSS